MVFTASLLGGQQERDSLENNQGNPLFMSLTKAVDRTSLSFCGRQVMGPSSLPVVVTQSTPGRVRGRRAFDCKPLAKNETNNVSVDKWKDCLKKQD